MLISLLSMHQTPPAQSAPPPRPAEAWVLVQGQTLTIPAMPASLDEARIQNPAVQARISQGLNAIEPLLSLSAPPRAEGARRLPVPAHREAEARRLLALLQDGQYRLLEAAVLDDLQAWEEAARTRPNGLDRPGPSSATDPVRRAAANPARRIFARDPGQGREGGAFAQQLSATSGLTDLAAHAANGEALKLDAPTLGALRHQAAEVRASAELAAEYRDLAPRLRSHWQALSDHLQAVGREVAEFLDEPPVGGSAALQSLKQRVRLQFLQRYQANLQLCAALWASLAP